MTTVLARPIAPGSGAFIALIAGMMTMTAMTIDINLPAIPITAAELGGSLTTSQLTVTIFFVGFAVGQLFWGPLSDRIGRKPCILVGTGIYVVASIGCTLAPEIMTLLALRAVQGIGAGAGAVLGRAIIRDLFDGARMARMLSLVMAAFITAPVVAPTIGAAILSIASWRWIYGFLTLYGLVMLALVALFLEESLKVRNPHALGAGPLLRAFGAVFRDPRSRLWSLIVVLVFGTLNAYLINSSAVLMEGYGLTAAEFGGAFALIALASSVGNLLNSRLVRTVPLVPLIRWSLLAAVLTAALALALAVTDIGGVWALVLAIGLFFVAFGPVAANGTTLALGPHATHAGAAAAALGFGQTVVPALIGGIVAGFYDGTAVPMLATILALFLLCWLIALRGGPARG
ncbi:MAG: multidrug effflux MFS transporter [Geminicoccaceae bacterium]